MDNLKPCKNHYILTFGYGNRKDYEEFIEYLEEFNVLFVIDVRFHPRAWSRKWYGDQIEKLCVAKGINYISSVYLGNTSGNANWEPPDQEEAQKSLETVAEIARSGTVLLLCAEKDWHRCHRVEVAHQLEKLVHLPVKHLV
ncbi:MAG: DUF488 family protein [Aulosira sp. ZfuVER01]|nr:DUF488 domain-containing protein [Aulosira sp. ZfuVER01]MDZ7999762.1 DUF488 domain-containing protein [Aulosira sp. DedVER01a]MDZ8055125.1 DUF488 domain-containing protein [Aulosira sp. ZfuCHP01]